MRGHALPPRQRWQCKSKAGQYNTLNHNLHAWGCADPRLLTQTATIRIYTVICGAETAILKLLAATETEEQRGVVALRLFDGCGAVRLLRWDAGAHLLEYAAGDELLALVQHGEDAQATRIIAQVLGQLHFRVR